MLYDFISKFNNYTENNFYKNIYFIISFILFISSFLVQYFYDKYCDFVTVIIRIIHHFCIFFIYCGVFAPTNYLFFVLTFSLTALLSWLFNNNACFLTTIESTHCHYKKKYRFHDLLYFAGILFSKLKLKNVYINIDKSNISYRIPLLIIFNIIILLRLYVYFTSNTSNKLEIHGHRGARASYPENSILAFDYAMSIGVDALELDLNMTKDKNIVIYHNRNIDTELCTNGLSLPIKELTLLEIKKYDCGVFQNKDFKEQHVQIQKIPTFIELLEWINNSNYSNKNTIKLNIEIKTETGLDTDTEVIEFAKELVSIVNKYNVANRTIIESFDERALKAVKNIDKNITLSLLIEDSNINMIELAKNINVDIISPEYSLLNKDLVKKMHDNKFRVLPWGINSTISLQEMIDINVDGIIADDPKKMIDYIKYKI